MVYAFSFYAFQILQGFEQAKLVKIADFKSRLLFKIEDFNKPMLLKPCKDFQEGATSMRLLAC